MRFFERWFGIVALTGLAFGLASTAGNAQSFLLSQNAKPVGSANLAIKPAGRGFIAASDAKVDMPGLKYTFKETQNLDTGYHLQTAQLTGSVNGTSATVSGSPQGQQFLMKINANGKVTSSPLASHPQAVFYPDFDPAALQIMLDLGAAHNNRDIWAIIPKQSGSVVALRIATKPDEQGTLDGKAIAVHHFTVTSITDSTEVFSGPENQLLQAEWTSEGFALVRQGFVIKQPAKPRAAPPVKQQPATQPGQTGQPGTAQPAAPPPQQ